MDKPDPRNNAPHPLRFAMRIGVFVIVLALAAGAAWYATRPKPIAVAVAQATIGRVETTVANTRAGSVMACRRAKLAPPAGGRIEKLNVRKGDRVRTGQVLLDPLERRPHGARTRVARATPDREGARARGLRAGQGLGARCAARARAQGAQLRLAGGGGARRSRCGGQAGELRFGGNAGRGGRSAHPGGRARTPTARCCARRSPASSPKSTANSANT